MSAADLRAAGGVRSRRDALLLSLGVLAAIVAAIVPVLSVVEAGAWALGALALVCGVLATGAAARAARLPAAAVSALEAVVWLVLLTALFGRSTALLGIVPTPATFASIPALIAGAQDEIRLGVAPVAPGTGLAFVLVAAIGALALVLDHVVVTARMPLLGSIGLVAVSLIPTIVVPRSVDVVAFVLLAAAVLFLLRVETRSRVDRGGRSTGSASLTAVGIAAIAVVAAIVVTPLLPQPALRFATGTGTGLGTTIDPNLQLGDDLRQPRAVDVLTVRTTAPTAPYLRAVTLSRFDGRVWQPDNGDTVGLPADGAVFSPVSVDDGIAVSDWTTNVAVGQLDSPWLPVPYPAATVTGLRGDWLGMPSNRTIVSQAGSTRDQQYQVQAFVPQPTLEQIRARGVGGDDLGSNVRTLPADVPDIIGETARQVTAGASTPYDALIALQSWFRSSQFRYSLDAPVEDGFDGAGLDAVADFLRERRGYCVHFASAFAVMARTLDMPSRIVVGYLPGTPDGTVDGQTSYTISSSQLHAWPEVYFRGIGWVPFEPTNSLGVPTSFASAAAPGSTSSSTGPQQQDAATPGAQPSAAPSLGDQNGPAASERTDGTITARGVGAWPFVGAGALALALLATPSVLRALRRRSWRGAAARGDALAAWTAVRETALDLGIPVPAAESPRRFAARIVERHGSDPPATGMLLRAVERASFAGDAIDPSHGPQLVRALDDIEHSMRASTPGIRRVMARMFPRSLVRQPGDARSEEAVRIGS